MTITISPYHVKTYSSCDTSNDWFSSVQSCLLWNNRQRQKSFVVVESDNDNPAKAKSDNMFACIGAKEADNDEVKIDDIGSKDDQHDNGSQDCHELNPWTDEELVRDPIKGYTFTSGKKESKI